MSVTQVRSCSRSYIRGYLRSFLCLDLWCQRLLQAKSWILLWVFFEVLSVGLVMGQSGLSARMLTSIATPVAPNLYDTLRIIKHPQGATQALAYLLTRSSQELSMMKTRALIKALSVLACPDLRQSEGAQQATRNAADAIRVFRKLGELGIEGECIGQLWRLTLGPPRRDMYGHRALDLIARLAAETLHQIGRVDLLIGALVHPDPRIRALAARSGAEPHLLCTLYTDGWSEVRMSAIIGLERVAGAESLCLTHYLKDARLSIRLRALRGLGRLAGVSDRSYSQGERARMIAEVRHIVHDSEATQSERNAALTALARWGERSDASDILEAHYERGGLLEFSKAALYALVIADATTSLQELKRAILHSPSLVIRAYAAQLLVDPRLKWSSIRSDHDQAQRRALLSRVVLEMRHRGETRIAEQLSARAQSLSDHGPNAGHQLPIEDRVELAPPLDEEGD